MSKHYDHAVSTVKTPDPIVEAPIKEVEVKAEKIKFGKVHGTNLLNVRKEPTTNSEIVVVINYEAELKIIESFKNPDWYKVVTYTGDEGYAMKEYVAIKE